MHDHTYLLRWLRRYFFRTSPCKSCTILRTTDCNRSRSKQWPYWFVVMLHLIETRFCEVYHCGEFSRREVLIDNFLFPIVECSIEESVGRFLSSGVDFIAVCRLYNWWEFNPVELTGINGVPYDDIDLYHSVWPFCLSICSGIIGRRSIEKTMDVFIILIGFRDNPYVTWIRQSVSGRLKISWLKSEHLSIHR